MRRREFLLIIGTAAMARQAIAQPLSKRPRIGYLMDRPGPGLFEQAFVSGLRTHGYIVGENIEIEYGWTEGKSERLPELAAELVSRSVDIIVTAGAASVKAAKAATTTFRS